MIFEYCKTYLMIYAFDAIDNKIIAIFKIAIFLNVHSDKNSDY